MAHFIFELLLRTACRSDSNLTPGPLFKKEGKLSGESVVLNWWLSAFGLTNMELKLNYCAFNLGQVFIFFLFIILL